MVVQCAENSMKHMESRVFLVKKECLGHLHFGHFLTKDQTGSLQIPKHTCVLLKLVLT